MTEPAPLQPVVTEQTVELRFTPNARVLDRRGEWAERLSAELALSRWHIGQDRIDILTEDETQRAFVSHRNAGFIVFDPPTRSLHSDRSQKFLRLLLALDGFSRAPVVDRFGVRHRYVVEFDGAFELLLTRVSTCYAGLTEQAVHLLGTGMRVTDIGLSLNLRDGATRLNTQCGPMIQAEFANHFKHRKAFPKVGLYVDLDCWQEPKTAMTSDDVTRTVAQYSEANWSRLQRLATAILSS